MDAMKLYEDLKGRHALACNDAQAAAILGTGMVRVVPLVNQVLVSEPPHTDIVDGVQVYARVWRKRLPCGHLRHNKDESGRPCDLCAVSPNASTKLWGSADNGRLAFARDRVEAARWLGTENVELVPTVNGLRQPVGEVTCSEELKPMQCGNCAHWLAEKHNEHHGLCRRYPEARYKAAESTCGEFKARS